jgi:hypothetical protein
MATNFPGWEAIAAGWTRNSGMTKNNRKRDPKSVLQLPDLERSKSAVLKSLTSQGSQRSYDHAIREFIDWYCSERRLGSGNLVPATYFDWMMVLAAEEHVFSQPPQMMGHPPPSAPDVTVRVHIDMSVCYRGVKRPPDVSEREFAPFEMHDIVVETVGQAIRKLPSARKWSIGMSRSVSAKNQLSIIDPLIVLLLPKIGALKLVQRFRGSLDICFVAIAAGMTPQTLVPATGAE